VDGAVSLRPIAVGRSGGRGTGTCVWRGAMAADVGVTVEALPFPVIVSPTCSCPLASSAKPTDGGSRHATKANLHIFLLPTRDQPSEFATVVCWDGTVLPSIRLAVAAWPRSSKNEAGRAFASTPVSSARARRSSIGSFPRPEPVRFRSINS
jgi:hypothetical protein